MTGQSKIFLAMIQESLRQGIELPRGTATAIGQILNVPVQDLGEIAEAIVSMKVACEQKEATDSDALFKHAYDVIVNKTKDWNEQ